MNLNEAQYKSLMKGLIKGNIPRIKIDGSDVATTADVAEKSEMYFIDGTPTLENDPFISWGSDFTAHAGDMAYDRLSGNTYQFSLDGEEAKWILMEDRLEVGVGTEVDPSTTISNTPYINVTADGTLIANNAVIRGDIYARNGYFSGELRAATGSFSGTVTASELTARNATLYGDNDNIIISISDRLKVTKENTPGIVVGVEIEEIVNSVTYRARLYPNSIVFSRSDFTNTAEIQYASDGKLKLKDVDVDILKNLSTIGNITSSGSITGHGSIAAWGAITSDSSITAAGAIKSTGGAVIANDCTAWNGGTAGGYISTGGRLALVSGSSSDYPNIVFVKNKNTNANTTLRANNTGSTTYTLTLPNSTGTLATTSSDIRLKENIKPSKVSALELIEKIKLHEFDWLPEGKEGAPHWKIGMIADELEELDENLVFGGGTNEDGSMNVKGIETTGLLAYVVGSIRELYALIKEVA